jgi:hypothetical protein
MSHDSIEHPLSRVLSTRPKGPMRSPARVLGWFSIGLGLVELAMPRAMSRAAGMSGSPRLMRAYGLREIGVGIGLLNARDPAPWLWVRVAGDALDMATVSSAFVSPRTNPMRTMVSLAFLAGITALDAAAAKGAGPAAIRHSGRDYSGRSGFPKPPGEMRGIAAKGRAGARGNGADVADSIRRDSARSIASVT